MFFRLDTIRSIKAGPVETKHEKYEGFAVKFDENLWGVSTGGDYSVDHVELTLHVEDNESYIIDRLEREKRHGRIEPIDSHTYKFVADVYDALISERCYKDAIPPDEAAEIIREEAGTYASHICLQCICGKLISVLIIIQNCGIDSILL